MMTFNFKLIFLSLSAIFFLLSCDNTAQQKEDPLAKERATLKDEVMAIHDEMMPDWRASSKAQTQLEKMITSATEKHDLPNVEKYQTAHQQLEVVYKEMKDWMEQYRSPSAETSNEDAISYFKDQKVKVVKMKEIMVENLKEAKKVVDFKTTSVK